MTAGEWGRARIASSTARPVVSGSWWSRRTTSTPSSDSRASRPLVAWTMVVTPMSARIFLTRRTIIGSSSTSRTLREGTASVTATRSSRRVVEEDQRLSLGDHRLQRLIHRRVQHRADQVAHPHHRDLGRHLLLVRARRREGVVDLHRRDDPPPERDLLAHEPVGVPEPVPPLVMAPHVGEDFLEVDQRREDLRPHQHVLLHVLVLLVRERPLLVEHFLADPDLPDIVQ